MLILHNHGLFTAGGDKRLLFHLNKHSFYYHRTTTTNPINPISCNILLKNLRKDVDWLVEVVVVVGVEKESGKKCQGGETSSIGTFLGSIGLYLKYSNLCADFVSI